MTAMLMLAGVLLSQSATLIEPQSGTIERVDVAYQAMSQGKTDAAIAQLRDKADGDPAALINLGTAYARKGMRSEALTAFNAAIASPRYELQLADGTWMDSRRAARTAAAQLEQSSALAAR